MDILTSVMMWLIPVAILIVVFTTLVKQYKICPNDKVMVVYGAGSSGKNGARIVHGGGTLVIPFFQSFKYMSLAPMSITVNLTKALSANNIRVNVPSQFTISIASKSDELMQNAVRYLLDRDDKQIEDAASEIIIGSLRAVVATLSIEELTRDREQFIRLINENVRTELNKIGMDLVNVNIRDITDESGYIEAMGKRAAAEAINRADIDVAEQDRLGSIGVETNNRERDVTVAQQQAQTEIGKKEAARDRDVKTAAVAAETVRGENDAKAEVARSNAQLAIAETEAQRDRDVQTASLRAETVKGKNTAQADIADSNAALAVREAEAFRAGEVARAQAATVVATEQRTAEQARLAKELLPAAEVAKSQVEIQAEAQAEQTRRLARGEADAVVARYEAEATGLQKVLEAKAAGYKRIIDAAGGDTQAAATLLMIEKMEEVIRIQTEALANIKIDKITVWDSGSGNDGMQGFIRNFASALPPLHEIAAQAGVELPGFMGRVAEEQKKLPNAETKNA
jgi:flotillin